jgi:hypothetical protein
MNMRSMTQCAICQGELEIERVRCEACGLALEGRFGQPRLGRLSPEDQRLIEAIVLAACNLKDVALLMEVSYPTLRKRLDRAIEELKALRDRDAAAARDLLDRVEAGSLTPEEAARRIRENNGG